LVRAAKDHVFFKTTIRDPNIKPGSDLDLAKPDLAERLKAGPAELPAVGDLAVDMSRPDGAKPAFFVRCIRADRWRP
jgi:hypothetical protein